MNKSRNVKKKYQDIVVLILITFLAVIILLVDLFEKEYSREYPIFLYYTDKNYSYLIPELQHVVINYSPPDIRTTEQLKTILYRLFYPSNTQLKSALPKKLKILDVELEKNTAIVKMCLNTSLGNAEEILMIAAIVNTLTELYEVKQVKIDFIKGSGLHLDYSKPFERDNWINLSKN